MTAQSDPYVRVYYRIIDDEKFSTVYDDDRRLATWLRLLMTADATYPAPAPIPIGIHQPTLQHLVEVGLVEVGTGHRYRIHGLKTERDARSNAGASAAAVRWGHATPNAGALPRASAPPMHSEPSRADPIRATPPFRIHETDAAGRTNGSKRQTDEQLILAARAVLADKMASEDRKRIARDALADLGVTA